MNIQVEELGFGQVQLMVEPDPAQVEQAKKKVAQKYRRQVKIRGFRPGKAPLYMVMRALGNQQLMEEAVQLIAQDVLNQALIESQMSVYSYDELHSEITQYDPLVFSFTFPRNPVVKLGDLKWIKVRKNEVSVSEKQVDRTLEEVRRRFMSWESVTGPAAYGDQATFDLRIESSDGTTVVNEVGRKLHMTPPKNDEEISETINLSPYLVGMTVDQISEFPLQYPNDWGNGEFAGQTMLYHIVLQDLKRAQLPELNDELAQSVMNVPTLAVWRERIHANLLTQARSNEVNRINLVILNELVDESEIEYPQLMLKNEIQQRIANLEQHWLTRGTTLTQVLENEGKTLEELEDDLRDETEDDLRRMLVLGEYVAVNDIKVTAEEIEREFKRVLRPYAQDPNIDPAALREDPTFLQQLANQIVTRKGLRHLYTTVMGEEPPVLFEEDEIEEASDSFLPAESEEVTESGAATEEVTESEGGTDIPIESQKVSDTPAATESQEVTESEGGTDIPIESDTPAATENEEVTKSEGVTDIPIESEEVSDTPPATESEEVTKSERVTDIPIESEEVSDTPPATESKEVTESEGVTDISIESEEVSDTPPATESEEVTKSQELTDNPTESEEVT